MWPQRRELTEIKGYRQWYSTFWNVESMLVPCNSIPKTSSSP